MTTAILCNDTHQEVRVDTRAKHEFGDLVNRAVVVSSEFNDAHKEFPILLYKDEASGDFASHVILGLDRDENLFVEEDRWISSYVPANIARGPFSLGYLRGSQDEDEIVDIRVMIDEEHPRIGQEGHPVFLELGGESPYLERIKKVLQVIDAGLRVDKVFYPQLVEMDLVEQADLRVRLSSEQEYHFTGYHTINQERLASLTGDQLSALNRAGTLGLVYFLISSLGNFQKLIHLKNARAQST